MMKRNIELTFGYSTLINRFKNISYPDSHEYREVIVLVQNPKRESFNPNALREVNELRRKARRQDKFTL